VTFFGERENSPPPWQLLRAQKLLEKKIEQKNQHKARINILVFLLHDIFQREKFGAVFRNGPLICLT